MNNGKHGQGNHCTKMGADSLAENTPKFIRPICTIGSEVWGIVKKGFIECP